MTRCSFYKDIQVTCLYKSERVKYSIHPQVIYSSKFGGLCRKITDRGVKGRKMVRVLAGNCLQHVGKVILKP